jgi:Xaa-Pro dipeptidase
VAELYAPRKAEALFAEIQAQSLIRPGAKESEINESVYALAGSMYGISRYWHKRIVQGATLWLPMTRIRLT